MLIEFSFANFRSINKIQSISFRATGLLSEDKNTDTTNIVDIEGNKLLKTIGIYGANASGKSNVIKALRLLKQMINSSLRSEDLSKTLINPFRQSIEKQDNAGFFQVVILLEEKKFRYGFTFNETGEIAEEWLFGPAKKNETYYFKRKGSDIDINKEQFEEGQNNPLDKLRNDVLFLTFCSSFNGPISKAIRRFFVSNVLIEGGNNTGRRLLLGGFVSRNARTNQLLEQGRKEIILDWMKEIGLHFTDVKLDADETGTTSTDVLFSKNIYNEKKEIVGATTMTLDEDESDGTKKYYSFIGRIQDKFDEGGRFICDEIDSNFHPTLLQKLIKMFNNPVVNHSNAQLLFTSHDTNLMDPNIMRRDQFYFSEKSLADETILYALSDLKGIRNNADFARQYLAGFYGALPVLGNYLEKKIDKK